MDVENHLHHLGQTNLWDGQIPVYQSCKEKMNENILLLGLSMVLLVMVGIYGYKEIMIPKPKPKVEIRYYHINF